MPRRVVRSQGAILRDHCVLLIKHTVFEDGKSYWLLPGGGQEPGETEEQTVRREMREETGLDVRVERLLIDQPAPEVGGTYRRLKTYLCTPVGGEALPGIEPEDGAAGVYAIAEVRWFDLRDPASWEPGFVPDNLWYPQVQRIRVLLGYAAD